MLELGIPYSDPIADGPTIQAAAKRALKAGAKIAGVLDCAAQIRAQLTSAQMSRSIAQSLRPLVRVQPSR